MNHQPERKMFRRCSHMFFTKADPIFYRMPRSLKPGMHGRPLFGARVGWEPGRDHSTQDRQQSPDEGAPPQGGLLAHCVLDVFAVGMLVRRALFVFSGIETPLDIPCSHAGDANHTVSLCSMIPKARSSVDRRVQSRWHAQPWMRRFAWSNSSGTHARGKGGMSALSQPMMCRVLARSWRKRTHLPLSSISRPVKWRRIGPGQLSNASMTTVERRSRGRKALPRFPTTTAAMSRTIPDGNVILMANTSRSLMAVALVGFVW